MGNEFSYSVRVNLGKDRCRESTPNAHREFGVVERGAAMPAPAQESRGVPKPIADTDVACLEGFSFFFEFLSIDSQVVISLPLADAQMVVTPFLTFDLNVVVGILSSECVLDDFVPFEIVCGLAERRG